MEGEWLKALLIFLGMVSVVDAVIVVSACVLSGKR